MADELPGKKIAFPVADGGAEQLAPIEPRLRPREAGAETEPLPDGADPVAAGEPQGPREKSGAAA